MAYVLFPFDDPFDGMDSFSTVSTIPVPLGFAPIGPPGSLAMPPRIMDTISLVFPSTGLPVSLLPSGPLPPCRVQPILEETSAVCHTWSSSVSMPAGDSPVESDLPRSSPPLAAIIPDMSSSPVVSTSCRSSRRSLSPGSVQLDGSFYSATDSPTGQASAMHPETTFDPSQYREGPFKAANPHPRIGDTKGF